LKWIVECRREAESFKQFGLDWKMCFRWVRLSLMLLWMCHVRCCAGWKLWTQRNGSIDMNYPAARRGHSLVMYGSKVVLFGGKGDDENRFHVPKTFELVEVDGRLDFASYDQKSVPKGSREIASLVEGDLLLEECLRLIDDDPVEAITKEECMFNGTKTEVHEKENYIPSSTFFNDLWWYDLDCERYSDDPCVSKGWELVDPGAKIGGCHLDEGEDRCTHPNERYGHVAQVVHDQYLIVYGGYSHFCSDYCDDLWIFVFQPGNVTLASSLPGWTRIHPLGRTPGKRWKAASTVVDNSRIFVFGGHRLWHGFSNDNSRANRWSSFEQLPKGGYLNDMWKLDLSACPLSPSLSFDAKVTALQNCVIQWEEILPKKNCTKLAVTEDMVRKSGFSWEERLHKICLEVWPPGRSGHSLVAAGNDLLMFGGYRTFFPYPNNQGPGAGIGATPDKTSSKTAYSPFMSYDFFLNDFWRFDVETGFWHLIEERAAPGVAWPEKRTEHISFAAEGLVVVSGGYHANYFMDDFWFYNRTTGRWFNKDTFVYPRYPENCTAGTPVLASPTRGRIVDGLFGRGSGHVLVNITRRQAPGWDGCRDRNDERHDLPWELQWEKPTQRSLHAATYSEEHNMLLLFGGQGFVEETVEQVSLTPQSFALADMWQYDLFQCVNNCSFHGDCNFGFCRCHDGYYGLDCSNVSCPGDFCFYDEISQEQICEHCCHAPYVHTDDDIYIAEYEKLSCSRTRPGISNGICDGYGECICAPPFVGLDCSIKDCQNECSGNGWCSYEYPVSRCMCNPGFTGDDCSVMECLNNCSYPNGVCNTDKGDCECIMWPNPYNRSRNWRRFEGADCSFLIPFASATAFRTSMFLSVALSLIIVAKAINHFSI